MEERTIIDKLKDTFNRAELGTDDVHGLQFYYADEGLQNLVIERTAVSEGGGCPFAAVVPITGSAVISDDGRYHERITIAVFFGDQMADETPDFDAIENERIIDACKKRAFLWLTTLHLPSALKELKFVQVMSAERGYLRLDGNYTGFAVVVVLEEISGVGMCEWKKATAPKFWEFVFDNKKYLKIGDNVELVGAHCWLSVYNQDAYIGGDLRRGSQIGSRNHPAEHIECQLDMHDILPENKRVSKIEIETCCAYNSPYIHAPYFLYINVGSYDISGGNLPELTPELTKYSWLNTSPDNDLLDFGIAYCRAAVWIKSIKIYFENA